MITCPECESASIKPSAVAGMTTCLQCGKLFVPPKTEKPQFEGEFTPDVPDYFEPMIGWRAWRIRDTPAGPRLHSVTYSHCFWTPRDATVAECEKKKHLAPDEGCTCGLYSAKHKAHLLGMGYHHYDPDRGGMNAVGEVVLWGKIVEGTQGWRAERGYPRELYVPFEGWGYVKPLSEIYGVPVRLNNFLGASLG
jgi:hypothetical protein